MIRIEIETVNEAFHPDLNREVARILQELSVTFEAYCPINDDLPKGEPSPLYDVNGNKVGQWLSL